ncbi:MAG: hypothetical protein WBV36_24575, partial [Terriglobales bacterium]
YLYSHLDIAIAAPSGPQRRTIFFQSSSDKHSDMNITDDRYSFPAISQIKKQLQLGGIARIDSLMGKRIGGNIYWNRMLQQIRESAKAESNRDLLTLQKHIWSFGVKREFRSTRALLRDFDHPSTRFRALLSGFGRLFRDVEILFIRDLGKFKLRVSSFSARFCAAFIFSRATSVPVCVALCKSPVTVTNW